MPAVDPRLQTIVDLLPADGSEISFDDWKSSIVSSGNYNAVPLTGLAARRSGLVTYRVEPRTDGEPGLNLFVSRAQA